MERNATASSIGVYIQDISSNNNIKRLPHPQHYNNALLSCSIFHISPLLLQRSHLPKLQPDYSSMAGKENTPSKATGPSATETKPLDKGKGKVTDAEEKKEPTLDKDGKPVEDEKVLPPGMTTLFPKRSAIH